MFVIGVIGAIITYYYQKNYAKEASQLNTQKDELNDRADFEAENDRMGGGWDEFHHADAYRLIEPIKVATKTAAKLGKAFVAVGIIGAVGIVVGGIIWGVNNNSLDKLYSETGNLADELADLNSWAVTDNLTAPVAGSLNFTTHEGSYVNESLNGTDAYDDPLSYSLLKQPANGTLTMGTEQCFIYKSNPGFVSNDTFTYNAQDTYWNLASNSANVTVTLNPDQAPITNNMNLFTPTGTVLNGILDAKDPDNDTLTYSMVTEPMYGTLKILGDGNFVYTPFENFTGDDSFTYKSNDSVLDSNTGNITIHVVNNTSPVAYNMVFNIAQNSLLNGKFNATGVNGTKKLFNILSKPSHGTLNILGEKFTYKPSRNYNGLDVFTYNFTDVLKQTSNLATVNIFIRSPPTSENIKLNTKMNFQIGSAFKIQGYNSASKVVSKPKHGTLNLLPNEKFSYQPNKDYSGTDTFTYQAVDSLGQKSSISTVSITITKPKIHSPTPTKIKNINSFRKPAVTTLNTPHLNLNNPTDLNMSNLNTTNLKMTNLNNLNINQTVLMTNPFTTLITKIINNLKTTINYLKL